MKSKNNLIQIAQIPQKKQVHHQMEVD